MRSRLALLIATLLFFISGSAALVYQTAWQRLLIIFAGGDIQAVTLIVTAFMLGLGIGSLAGGCLADRQSWRRNILTFALLETAVGLWGLSSEWLYHDLLCLRLGALTSARFTSAVILILMLLPPTMLMGMSLPLLSRALTRTVDEAAARISQLYGINALGAAVGALLTTWCLLPISGISGSISYAGAMNLFCAIGILPLLRLGYGQESSCTPLQNSAPLHLTWQMRGFLTLYAITGFLALGLEMTWFRVLGVMLKSTAFTFGTLLGIYLTGLGLGSLIGSCCVHRSRSHIHSFLWMQAALSLYAGLSLSLLLWFIHHAGGFHPLLHYLDSYEPLDVNTSISMLKDSSISREGVPDPWLLPLLHGLLPAMIILPSTFLMGLSFPFLQRAAQTHADQIGARVGWLQAANIAGSVVGTLIVGMGLLSWLGSAGTLELLMLIGTGMGAFALLGTQWLRVKLATWLVLSLITLLAIPDASEFWASIHGSTPEKLLHVEDSTGITAFKAVSPSADQPGDTMVYVNGIGQSWLPFGGIHSVLGALPALLHPRPEHIAIIGLGSGDTAYSAAGRYETAEVCVVEIIGSQAEAMKRQQERHPSVALKAFLSRDNIRHVHADGRRFLMMTDQRFDIIEADALRPNSAGSGILYSEEYYRLVSRRLKPGGYAVSWVPTPRVRSTFLTVFPHVLDFGIIAIGSPDPIPATADDLRRRLGHLEIRQHFRLAEIPIHQLLASFAKADFHSHLITPETDRSQFMEINTDLFPRDEFHLPALWKE
jgi:spermidine synthase